MDHRISKDMISQGMSFKGEKTTEQLNGTQIGKIATPHNMLDAYQSMYSEDAKWGYDPKGNSLNPADKKKKKKVKEDVEQINEIPVLAPLVPLAAKAVAAGGAKALAGKAAGSLAKQAVADKAVSTVMGGKKKTEEGTESNPDDLIQELKDSGLFSEEEINNILAKEDMNKGYVVTAADKKGNTPAWQGYKAGKTKKDGKPLYRPADHLK